jgi:hydroxylamine reductase
MFCYQCEQTAKGEGCTVHGVCGKDPATAAMQDLLIYVSKGVARYVVLAEQMDVDHREADRFVVEALFTTVTNVNFDVEVVESLVRKGADVREHLRQACEKACSDAGKEPWQPEGPAVWQPPESREDMMAEAAAIGLQERMAHEGRDVTGLRELITYGLKGSAAYLDHARILGREDPDLYLFISDTLAYITDDHSAEELFAKALEVGEKNLKVMELLDAANTGTYGHPEPTRVRVTPVKGKAIVVSGHDLRDLAELLAQTEGTGINVYTHGEMLPCNAYPELKRYDHLVGNYGGAWQDQQREFEEFPGAILMTTNCIQKPRESYKDRIFTTDLVRWPGVKHVEGYDFTPVIERAKELPGFTGDAPEKRIPIGFARNAVLSVADRVIEAVKAGDVRHFFLIGGCDGAKPGRNYYTRLAEKVPEDCVILTLACGKYRFNKLDFGEIGGIPRLLDCGQCNDAYSAIAIAGALADAFDVGVNDLPLSLILSWYEQKAVTILLSLLHLGIRDMKLGPTMPAFLTPMAVDVLVDKFGIAPISTPEEDLAEALGR